MSVDIIRMSKEFKIDLMLQEVQNSWDLHLNQSRYTCRDRVLHHWPSTSRPNLGRGVLERHTGTRLLIWRYWVTKEKIFYPTIKVGVSYYQFVIYFMRYISSYGTCIIRKLFLDSQLFINKSRMSKDRVSTYSVRRREYLECYLHTCLFS